MTSNNLSQAGRPATDKAYNSWPQMHGFFFELTVDVQDE